MKKRFNTTGVCIPKKHYMADISENLNTIKKMIEDEKYFVINRPRQYGKTTTMYMLKQYLKEDFLVLSMSFEGIDEEGFNDSRKFTSTMLKLLANSIKLINKDKSNELIEYSKTTSSMFELSECITEFVMSSDKPVILLIDEVDKNLNNDLFLNFLGMLRNKYLLREQEEDVTFQSVILAGVYDIKNLKLKVRCDNEKKYNSPWNIAVNFNVDMSFSSEQIENMIKEYSICENINMNTKEIAELIEYYTDGYPFLVSRICQIITEEMIDSEIIWDEYTIKRAIKYLLGENNTLFDDLIKNIENNTEFKEYIFELIMNNAEKSFNIDNPIINLGTILGYLKNVSGKVKISNRIFEQRLYNYYSSKLENKVDMSGYNYKENFIVNKKLNFEKILLKFQQFMKEQYSSKDEKFIEHHGRLLFLAFIKPIINGIGFDFKEVQISEEKRLDVVITYLKEKYIVELKIWRGAKYHEKGLAQLKEYLDNQGLDKGYLLIYDFNANKEYKYERINFEGKEIFIVWV